MILYYVHDPMCSWCWGFRPTWEKIQSSLAKEVEVKYLLGGLAPDNNEPMSEAMKMDIAGHWKKIQQHMPNTEFNFDFWEKCEPRRSTYPACRAVIAAKNQNLGVEREMIKAIQMAYYLNVKNPSDDDVLIELAEQMNLDKATFIADLNSAETKQQLKNEIMFAQNIGVRGFPSMIIEKGGSYQYVPLNYSNSNEAVAFIHAELL